MALASVIVVGTDQLCSAFAEASAPTPRELLSLRACHHDKPPAVEEHRGASCHDAPTDSHPRLGNGRAKGRHTVYMEPGTA